MAGRASVAELAAELLEGCDVGTAFGIISVHNLPLLDAIARRGRIRFVTARGEMGATHMADGHARASGKLGVVITSTGPGAASAVSGLVEARFAGSPVLHITAQTPTRHLDLGLGTVHEVPDQLGMLRTVSKSAYRVRSAQGALGTLLHAAAEALTPPMGPVSVEIPVDLQLAEVERPQPSVRTALPIPPALAPRSEALAALVDRVSAARRPMLWCGGGARHAGEPIARLAALGMPVATSWNGRGVLAEDHPLALGPLGTLPEVERCYESVDLMIVAGSRLRGHETRDGTLRLPGERVQIDVDARAQARAYASALFVQGDSALTLAALADRLEGVWRADARFGEEIARMKAQAIESYRSTLGCYADFPGIIRAAMPRDALWVRDITFHQTTWANRIFPVYGPRDSIYSVGAAIGTGMPLAIGAALATKGRKTVAMCGDGGFMLNFGELWTALQERPDICFLLMNDGGYGVIRHLQDAQCEGRRFYDQLLAPDFEALAQRAGMPYWRVRETAQLGAHLGAALRMEGPTMVEVDMQGIGPFRPEHRVPSYGEKP
jgi:acetolactate synthase-1/2/3 large subunit